LPLPKPRAWIVHTSLLAPAIAESEPTQATVDTIQPAVASTNIEPATPATTELDIYAPYYAFATTLPGGPRQLICSATTFRCGRNCASAEVATTPTETITEPAEAITTTKVDVKAAVGYYVIGGSILQRAQRKTFLKRIE
jgi:hypothetical protein